MLEETEVLEQNGLACCLKELMPAKEGLREVRELEAQRIRIAEVIRI